MALQRLLEVSIGIAVGLVHVPYWHAPWLYFTAPTLGTLVAPSCSCAFAGVHPFRTKLDHTMGRRKGIECRWTTGYHLVILGGHGWTSGF